MKTITVSILNCKPGMKIAETLYNDYGAVIILENTIIDSQALKRMENLKILNIKVYEENKDQSKEKAHQDIHKTYKQNVNDIKGIMTRIAAGASIDMTQVRCITDSISDGIYSNTDIVGALNEVRSVGEYTYSHCINVSFLAMMIGKWMNCNERTIKHLIQAGLLHDIGKCRVSQELITKSGSLTKEEFNEMKKHPIYGYTILQEKNTVHEDVLRGVLMHHEREDGTGYPTGVKSDKINLIAKTIAIADIYDAMTSDRAYRKRQSPFEVFKLMQSDSYGKLHPVILDTFIRNIGMYYVGSKVRLSDGQVAEVVFMNPRNISSPIVKVNTKYIDLTQYIGLKIEEMLVEDIRTHV